MRFFFLTILMFLFLCSGKTYAQNNKLSCDSTVSVPASFTPNEDGINEILIPHFEMMPYEFKFSVYNRWGALLFETTDLQKAWHPATEQPGVFYWIVKYKYSRDGEWFQCNGNVTLLR